MPEELRLEEFDKEVSFSEVPIERVEEELRKFLELAKVNIKVIGVGGAGCNTINRLYEMLKNMPERPELIAINTDAGHLLRIKADKKILIGREITKGRGTGANPDLGRKAAREAENEIRRAIKNSEMVFITAGLGGGTGSGASPVVAEIAKNAGAVTIAVVTLPFSSEGPIRWKNAKDALAELESTCDTVIIIPNDKLKEIVPDMPIEAAFKVADEILANAIRAVTEVAYKNQDINVDFNDIKTVLKEGGVAMIGIGESNSERRAEEAINRAISNPLLSVDITGAKAALILVEGSNITVKELDTIMKTLQEKMDRENANIIMGLSIEPELGDTLRVILIVTGVKSAQIKGRPVTKEEKEIEKNLGVEIL